MTIKKARGYVRLSQTSEVSVQNQKDDIREYCEKHDSLELDHIYNEGQNASGWDDSREQYQQMISDAKDGGFDVLIVAHGSRLGRDKLERLDVFTDLNNKWGMEFHTCKRAYVDPNLPEDILMEVFHSLSDDEGKGAEVERLTKAVEKKIQNGEYHGAPKFGTKYSDDKTSLVESDDFDTALAVLKLREQGRSYRDIREETECTLPKIKRVLEDEDVYRTIEKEGKWKPSMNSEQAAA